MNDKQKKLLLLGGSSYLRPVIREAHALGIHVITCDYLPDNAAHKLSDQYLNISILDKDAVLEAAQELQIDGVMSFACDPGVVTAAYVAEKLGLPSPGSYESTCILQDKGRFRAFLRDNGFTVPWAHRYTDKAAALAAAKNFTWPCIVKPVDCAGSKGVRRVDSSFDLAAAIDYALAFSHGGAIIIEQFIRQSGLSCRGGFVAYYNDMNVYAPDPMWMLSRAVVILIGSGGQLFISRADLTREELAVQDAVFSMFAQGRYFSIRDGEFAGSYQISDDYLRSEEFPNPRAYRRFLLFPELGD